jgi:hypothetical protein
MALTTNFPNGFASGVTIRGVPIIQTNPGKVFWVYNGTALQQGQRGGSNGNRGTYDSPFASILGALANCVANRGDIIFVKPGHAETITTAAQLCSTSPALRSSASATARAARR